MNRTNKKRAGEKTISLFEILIMLAGTICFAVFVGNNFGFVSASGGVGGTSTECSKTNPVFTYAGRQYSIITSTMVTGIGCDTSGNCKQRTYTKSGGSWYWTNQDGSISNVKVDPAREGSWISSVEGCLSRWTTSTQAGTTETPAATEEPTDPLQVIRDVKDVKGLLDSTKETATPRPAPAPDITTCPPGTTLRNGGNGGVCIADATGEVVDTGLETGVGVAGTAAPIVTNTLGSLGHLAANAGLAVGIYFGVKAIANALGANPQFADQLAMSMAVGFGIGALASWIATDVVAVGAGAAGGIFGGIATGLPIVGTIPYLGLIIMGIAALGCFLGLWCQEAEFKAVSYSCYPWSPATGGADCEKCNTGQFPCSEYKCQSLGQNCEIVNKGTKDELCVWNNKNDISPPTIESWDQPLPADYSYTPDSARLPPDRGVIIQYAGSADGCAPPFARLTYGISLDKPGRCKLDINVRKDTYEEMSIVIDSGFYRYNHTLYSFNLGEGVTSNLSGGNYEIYVRCQSKNGVSNEGTFVFKYCISNEPDTTPPTIVLTDPMNGMPITFGQESIDVNVYVNKPAECRWSHTDEDFDTMAETMSIASSTEVNANMVYKASATLTGLNDGTDNLFYFRCKSYPGNDEADRYKNEESYVYKLVGTRSLVIDSVGPNGTIKDSTDSIKVTLAARTSAGYKDGEAKCYFKKSGDPDSNYVRFVNTDSFEHSQDLWLIEAGYIFSIKCCDLGGNCDTKETTFEVITDGDSPLIARVYKEANKLKLVTDEKAECAYSLTDCSYNFEDGVKLITADNLNHLTDWNTKNNFYIKCKDGFGNQPLPNQCNIIVRPSEY